MSWGARGTGYTKLPSTDASPHDSTAGRSRTPPGGMDVPGLQRRDSVKPLLNSEQGMQGPDTAPGLALSRALGDVQSPPGGRGDDDASEVDMQPLRSQGKKGRARVTPHRPMTCCESVGRWVRGWLVRLRLAAHPPFEQRNVYVGATNYTEWYPPNVVRNQKYSVWTFLPMTLYEQFKYFFNMYFLLVAVSQFYPPLQVGFLFTYVAPLVFVIAVSLLKEAYDDLQRCFRDRAMNSELYEVVQPDGTREQRPSSSLGVGTVLALSPNQRIPADCILIHSSDKDGSFIRTDQLDGETDWKLRLPIPTLAGLSDAQIMTQRSRVWVDAPHQRIYDFVGRFLRDGESLDDDEGVPLSLENTLWQNCVLATGHCLAVVVYTGRETRACQNASQPTTKFGLIDTELNFLAKVLFVLTMLMALALVGLQRFVGQWYITFFRFTLLFSSIIPISLRVNLDMAKAVYCVFIALDGQPPFPPTDEELQAEAPAGHPPRALTAKEEQLKQTKMPGVAVRNTNLPEELGRIGYLFSDKTGTLTKNDMIFRKMFTGTRTSPSATGWYHTDSGEMSAEIRKWYETHGVGPHVSGDGEGAALELLRAVMAVAVTHNVTPVVEPDSGRLQYQAASPDEVALVSFADGIGMALVARDRKEMAICVHSAVTEEVSIPLAGTDPGWSLDPTRTVTQLEEGGAAQKAGVRIGDRVLGEVEGEVVKVARPCWSHEERFTILAEFPFTSESKRMGIVVKHKETGRITFYMKGADAKMTEIVCPVPWLDEQCKDLAREGLRTLVYGAREMEEDEYRKFSERLRLAKLDREDPKARTEQAREEIERGLEFLAVTGVEDRLQDGVALTLQNLRSGGVKVWMLTGDKVETAICIARSTQLVSREGRIFPTDCLDGRHGFVWEVSEGWRPEGLEDGRRVSSASDALDFLRCFRRFREAQHHGASMVLDGGTLDQLLQVEQEFTDEAGRAASVIVARCSPTQKAFVVNTVRSHLPKGTKLRTAAIGDGGNDVSMILAADVGLGIEGKEGKHASLAADFSLTQFSHCLRLITWHGRNSYRRSARLSQFVIHRGLIISVIQGIFSAVFYYMSVPIYTGWLLVGYSTVYTMFPVFAIVLDEDVTPDMVFTFPELYKELHKSRALNLRTFLQWVFKAVYQGGAIMLMAMLLFESAFIRIVSITFTALIFTELITVWFEMHKFSWMFLLAEVISLALYVISFFVLDTTFDEKYIMNQSFWQKTCLIAAVSVGPPTVAKALERRCWEPRYSKIGIRDPFRDRLVNFFSFGGRTNESATPHSTPHQSLMA
eukprot:Hpha_TRINITY_DN15709_c4_g5::TRINITY_DN15709_c4_g5_i1::g.37294::m.37294/K01530/E3.6.3.1; phospholipid-translocating ATPase